MRAALRSWPLRTIIDCAVRIRYSNTMSSAHIFRVPLFVWLCVVLGVASPADAWALPLTGYGQARSALLQADGQIRECLHFLPVEQSLPHDSIVAYGALCSLYYVRAMCLMDWLNAVPFEGSNEQRRKALVWAIGDAVAILAQLKSEIDSLQSIGAKLSVRNGGKYASVLQPMREALDGLSPVVETVIHEVIAAVPGAAPGEPLAPNHPILRDDFRYRPPAGSPAMVFFGDDDTDPFVDTDYGKIMLALDGVARGEMGLVSADWACRENAGDEECLLALLQALVVQSILDGFNAGNSAIACLYKSAMNTAATVNNMFYGNHIHFNDKDGRIEAGMAKLIDVAFSAYYVTNDCPFCRK